jgi:Uma2 family endonuclease
MQPAVPDRLLTEEEFLDWIESQDGKYELEDGRVVPRFGPLLDDDGRVIGMAGGTVQHAEIAINIVVALRRKLAGTGCRALGSDVAVRVAKGVIRYPDVGVFCDREELATAADKHVLEKPRVLFEVLSKSTERQDRTGKLFEYQAMPSVDTVVLVSAKKRWLNVYERMDERRFISTALLFGSPLVLRDPAVTLAAQDIFGADVD